MSEELRKARETGVKMGIHPSQLTEEEGKIVYRSLDFNDLNEVVIPSADFVTLRDRMKKGLGWGKPFDPEIDRRERVDHTLDADQIREDMGDYVDGQFVQYIRSGGPCNFELPFETVTISGNYPMDGNAVEKLDKKFQEELKLGYVARRSPEMKVYRETKQGAIPKARKDRKAKAAGDEYRCRTISDFSAKGTDGLSINEETGKFRKLELPQGDRVHSNIWEAHDFCIENGKDPRKIKGVKVDIKTAFRTLCTHPADYWALCFLAGTTPAYHKRWPFGLKTSVYNFLRLPLLIITYLIRHSKFEEWGARAAMYFDDLIILAHEDVIEKAVQVVLELFERWKIPRQEEKFLEDNPNGAAGSSLLTILGLVYDLANLTIAIPKPRVSEIMGEMKSFMKDRRKRSLKEWESTVGVVNWTTTAIPQIRMYLTKSWNIIRAIKNKNSRKRKRGESRSRTVDEKLRIKMIEDVHHDWEEIIFHLSKWNGRQKLMREEWEDFPEEGFNIQKGTIAPASDASGGIGWGAVCQEGYAYGKWNEEEKRLKIHIKEGLGLFALISLFGKSLCRRKVNLTLRCDNQSITSALKKGRAKDQDLALVLRLIVSAMIEANTMLKFWRTGKGSRTRVEYITSKNNRLADALSRGDMDDFHEITNKFPTFKNMRYHLKQEDATSWQGVVKKITSNMDMRETPRSPQRQE